MPLVHGKQRTLFCINHVLGKDAEASMRDLCPTLASNLCKDDRISGTVTVPYLFSRRLASRHFMKTNRTFLFPAFFLLPPAGTSTTIRDTSTAAKRLRAPMRAFVPVLGEVAPPPPSLVSGVRHPRNSVLVLVLVLLPNQHQQDQKSLPRWRQRGWRQGKEAQHRLHHLCRHRRRRRVLSAPRNLTRTRSRRLGRTSVGHQVSGTIYSCCLVLRSNGKSV